MSKSKKHRAGFISIVGKPNVGKSTLMNGLVGEKLSIITSKAQTTRHRILGIISEQNFQVIFSDTPGVIDPAYPLQGKMMKAVMNSLEDADVILWVKEIFDKNIDPELEGFLSSANLPVILILNKADKYEENVDELINEWKTKVSVQKILAVSALKGEGLEELFGHIIDLLPFHPPYYDDEYLSDRPERFFVSEIIREKIFLHYKKEIPYSSEVGIEEYKEDVDKEGNPMDRIRAMIYVERDSQKGIIIGKKGEAIKKVGVEARKDIEELVGKKVFLEIRVKVRDNWRKDEVWLSRFGY